MGCYRKGEAADPEVYVTSVATVLASYPEDVVRYVTHPNYGLPSKLNWLPTVAEVKAACEAEMKPRYEQLRQIQQHQRQQQLLAAPVVSEEQRAKAVERWEDMREQFAKPDAVAKPKETPDQIMARLEAEKGKTVVVGEGLAKKLAEMTEQGA